MSQETPEGPRSALVTGATRGIGHASAVLLARHGFALTIAARDVAALHTARTQLLIEGAPTVVVQSTDMGDPEAVTRLVGAHEAAFSDLSVLILAAGVGTAGPLSQYPRARWDRQLAVNTTSAFTVIAESLPMLRAAAVRHPATGSKVVALSSIGGRYAEPGLAAYGASKAALISLCRSVNVEEAGAGVTATALCPAYVDTDMTKWIQGEIPADSMLRVADVTGLIEALILLSPAAVVSEIVISRASDNLYRA